MTTDKAIAYYGSKKALARALDVWPHAISRWVPCPPKARQYELEVRTGGVLKVEANLRSEYNDGTQ